jgi:hypothetical protein
MKQIRKYFKINSLFMIGLFCLLLGISQGERQAFADIANPSFAMDEHADISKSQGRTLWESALLEPLRIILRVMSSQVFNVYRPSLLQSKNLSQNQHPPLDGTFMQPATLDYNDIPAYFDEIRGLGMDIVIIQNVRTKETACEGEDCCTSKKFRWVQDFPAKLGWILDQAGKRGIEVFVGLDLTSHGLCPLNFYEEPNASLTIDDTRKAIAQVMQKFGNRPALSGWYLPDEPSLGGWIRPELAYDYYSSLVSTIKRVSSKPILVSPNLVGVQALSPNELAYRALSFRNATGVDILLWQDAAGAEGAKLKWSSYSRSFSDYLSAIVHSLGGDATWSVHEAFNCCVISSGAENGAAYRPASLVRLLAQFEDVESLPIAKKITWIQQHHFGSVDTSRHFESSRLLDAYKAQFGLADEYLQAAESYDWIDEPEPVYNDRGNEMFNLLIGNPNDFTNAEWVGIDGKRNGKAEIVIDLGAERTINWIGFHLMSMPQVGIRFPKGLSLACLSPATTWDEIGRWEMPIKDDGMISEYLFSNSYPLESVCSTIKATLYGEEWIFISEIEIVVSSGEKPSFMGVPIRGFLYP